MERKEIIIDGSKFNTLDEFFVEIDNLLTKNLNWKTGHNFNAFIDLLRGGFGVHEYDEPILIKWINFQKSKSDFGYNGTIQHYKNLLNNNTPNVEYINGLLKDAEKHIGETLLDVIIGYIKNYGHNCMLEIID